MFEVICLETNEPVTVGDTVQLWPDAKDAAQWIEAQRSAGKRYRLRKLQANTDWRERESNKLKDGTYTPLPDIWTSAEWWKSREVVWKHHFAHMSKDGFRVAFTPDDKYGSEDNQLVLTPSRYLARAFTGEYAIKPHDISQYANQFGLGKYQILYSDKPADFAKVYSGQAVSAESSSYLSCMPHTRNKGFSGPLKYHPAYAFGGGDLMIAYIRDPDKRRIHVLARAVINKKTKVYVRVYGRDQKMRDILASGLRNAGYEQGGTLAPARLLRLLHSSHSSNPGQGMFIMPYIDGSGSIDDSSSKRLVLSERSGLLASAGSTSGLGSYRFSARVWACRACLKTIHRKDSKPILWNNRGYPNDTVNICGTCMSNMYVATCYKLGVRYNSGHAYNIVALLPDGTFTIQKWSPFAFDTTTSYSNYKSVYTDKGRLYYFEDEIMQLHDPFTPEPGLGKDIRFVKRADYENELAKIDKKLRKNWMTSYNSYNANPQQED